MEILKYVLLGIDGVLCLVIIALMLLQAGKGAGSSIMGGDSSDSGDGYLSHNKDRSRDARLRRATLTSGILFMVITYILGLLYLM